MDESIRRGQADDPGGSALCLMVAVEANPTPPGLPLALARAWLTATRPDRAVEALHLAVARGRSNRDALRNDPAWEPLRRHPRYAELIQRLDGN